MYIPSIDSIYQTMLIHICHNGDLVKSTMIVQYSNKKLLFVFIYVLLLLSMECIYFNIIESLTNNAKYCTI